MGHYDKEQDDFLHNIITIDKLSDTPVIKKQ